jgi:hypothetical protein
VENAGGPADQPRPQPAVENPDDSTALGDPARWIEA